MMQRKVIKIIEKIDEENAIFSNTLDLHDYGLIHPASPEIVHNLLKKKKSWFRPNKYGLQKIGTKAKINKLLVQVDKAVADSTEDGYIEPDRTISLQHPRLRVTGKGRKFLKWYYYPKIFLENSIVKTVVISVIVLVVTYYVRQIFNIPQSFSESDM